MNCLKILTKDELIKKFFSVEFTRFFNYYQKSKDLNVAESQRCDRRWWWTRLWKII